MNFKEIRFPVFKIGNYEPEIEDGHAFKRWLYLNRDTAEIKETVTTIDDKSVPGNTLGVRRLNIMAEGRTLSKLKSPIYLIGDLVRETTGQTWFIDTSGKIFKYIKTTFVKVKSHKILKLVYNVNEPGCSLELEGIVHRMQLPFVPADIYSHAAVAYFGGGHFLYSLLVNPLEKPIRRKV